MLQKNACLTEAASLTFRFEKAENVVFTDRSLDVTDDGARSVVHEFNADLSNTTTGASTAENLSNLGKLDGSLLCVLLKSRLKTLAIKIFIIRTAMLLTGCLVATKLV